MEQRPHPSLRLPWPPIRSRFTGQSCLALPFFAAALLNPASDFCSLPFAFRHTTMSLFGAPEPRRGSFRPRRLGV